MTTKADVQTTVLLDVLQQAVNTELTVSNHYWTRARYWAALPRLRAYYDKEADEERGHARMVADRMVYLGRHPTLQPTAEQPVTSGSVAEQLEEDLRGEAAVADAYRGWVQEALDRQDFTTYGILKQILKETEDHLYWLQLQLGLVGKLGEDNYLQTWVGE